jgi:DNA (cytosine-5)-methyltransferase 1
MNELALFAGAGGGILGGKLLGWRTVCAVEWEPYPASVLVARQNDGFLPPFPIWDDVQTFDGKPWRGIVDVVSGGFPCQDISSAGRGAGIDGERSGMWREMARIIHEVQPRFAFVENSPMLTSRGLGTVLGDLASMGFDARWGVLGAADVGANHQRDRIWIIAKRRGHVPYAQHNRIGRWEQQQESVKEKNVAYSKSLRYWNGRKERDFLEQDGGQVGSLCSITSSTSEQSSDLAYTKELFCNGSNNNIRISMEREAQSESGNDCWQKAISNTDVPQQQRGSISSGVQQKYSYTCDSRWWEVEPDLGRVADGVAARVDRLKAIGNGQVPLCAATAWRILSGSI